MKKIAPFLMSLCFLSVFLQGCSAGKKQLLDPKKPVTVTMWHNFGGIMKDSMVTLIDEFNNSVGKEKGIIINVDSITASREQNEKLAMIAEDTPGAPDMPDIVTAYPLMAISLSNAGLLAQMDDYFTQEELAAYVPHFVEEGRLPDGRLYVFPVSKSTEALFLNKTLFDRFSQSAGVSLGDLATFEGIARTAVKYYEWTDGQTPDIPNDGKAFFTADSWFNLAEVGTAQLKGEFVKDKNLDKHSETFQRIWDLSVSPALSGGYAVADGYSRDLYKTGEIVCAMGSTAGILFYGDTVIYPDNTSEKIESIVLPYPVFEGGQKVALQRGAGMVIAKSTPQKELAAATFLKWFTATEQNMRFVFETGYLPVTREAFKEKIGVQLDSVENPLIRQLLDTAVKTYDEYDFITPPDILELDTLSNDYEKGIKAAMTKGRKEVTEGSEISAVSRELLEAFKK
jgi:multiple sugar transport system substrate-binding protein